MKEEVTVVQAPMDQSRAEKIVDRVNAYIAAGVRVSRICAESEVDLGREQLEKLLSEQNIRPLIGQEWFGGQAEAHLFALERWLTEEDAERSAMTAIHAETETFGIVYGALSICYKTGSMKAITGPNGIGKTFGARAVAHDFPRRPNEPGAVYFEFGPGTKGDAGVLDTILTALDPYGTPTGTVSRKLDRILDLLRPGDFLIADECGIPAERGTGLRFMSYIHEQAGIPVAMIGNTSFRTAVWGKRSDYDALASRTQHLALGGNSEVDVDAWMDFKGLSGRKLKQTVMTVVCQSGREGGLRGAQAVLGEMLARNLEVTPENFLETAKLFGRMG
ncbi:MAG: ATP-binding protein [Zoogloea sp.]|nr:ATP-binding protein [Zoogloea sp.]MCA0186024.1 ATP-binding protein [Pseudomonadota bacterium]